MKKICMEIFSSLNRETVYEKKQIFRFFCEKRLVKRVKLVYNKAQTRQMPV